MAQVLCPSDVDLLPFALGQPVSSEVRRRLDDCPRCRERLEHLRREKAGSRGDSDDSADLVIPTLPEADRSTTAVRPVSSRWPPA